MTAIREPAVAGYFYPAEPEVLRSQVNSLLADGEPGTACPQVPKALIVPHAGYPFSGRTAARTYRTLAPGLAGIRRVVLLGPSHRVPLRGMAIPGAEAFRSPLGTLPLDTEAMALALQCPAVVQDDLPHAPEHSLEVQVPFIQTLMPDAQLVPVVVGDARPEEVAGLLESLWGGDETCILISSDLSHFHPAEEARALDDHTTERILALATDLNGEEACGCRAINGLLEVCRRRGLTGRVVARDDSSRASGDRSRVVGYGGYAFA